MGYRGGVSMSPKVYQNPLTAAPPAGITMTASEVNSVATSMGLPMWRFLNPSQKKMVAARVLKNRGDATSNSQANQVLLSNPAYQVFTIIYGAAGL